MVQRALVCDIWFRSLSENKQKKKKNNNNNKKNKPTRLKTILSENRPIMTKKPNFSAVSTVTLMTNESTRCSKYYCLWQKRRRLTGTVGESAHVSGQHLDDSRGVAGATEPLLHLFEQNVADAAVRLRVQVIRFQ